MISRDDLRRLEIFSQIEDETLSWLLDNAETVTVADGEMLVREGEPSKGFFVLLDGEMVVLRRSEGKDMVLGRHIAPSFFGEVQILSGSPVPVSLRAVVDCRLLRLSEDGFHHMLTSCRNFSRNIHRAVETRLLGLERFVQQREKMGSLGTLAAGLAQELDTPAAAMGRAVARLGALIADLERQSVELGRRCPAGETLEAMTAVGAKPRPGESAADLHPLAMGEREEELAEWLEDRGIDDPWNLGPRLANEGIDEADLEALSAVTGADAFPVALQWVVTVREMRSLLADTQSASGHITGLVKAFRSYTHTDEGPQQVVDIHDGIEDTLIVLRHKLRAGVRISRIYDRSLPPIPVFGSEINQVWTHLIDNAVEALGGEGDITITTRRDGDNVVVEVADNGPGIPPEIRDRVFDPFFSTKGPGRGATAGLDACYRIVVNRHGGSLRLNPEPGTTCFETYLPIAGVSGGS